MPTIYGAYRPPPQVLLGPFDLKREAVQSERDQADVNKIVQRFATTGVLPPGSGPGMYADVSRMSDYREALEMVREADRTFMTLPAGTRAKFNNDPAEFLDFVANADEAEMVDKGLLVRRDPVVDPAPAPVPAVPPG